ncbi:MAG TPA: glycoside hydrolase family 9 protein [Prolixibacteraceae bacterium]|nr:glycoside hydrolase family 9 protein [Prolixibacteraceae bacterium]
MYFKLIIASVILYLLPFPGAVAQITQEGRNIPYFSSYTAPKTWNSFKSDVYLGGGALFVNSNGDLPVDLTQGKGSLVFESTKPSGYWNVLFRIGWGMPVDYLRMGNKALLHLRLKWEAVATGADLEIQVYTQENNIAAGFPEQYAGVLLSKYIQPSLDWADVYIPVSDFQKNNPKINLSRVPILRFVGVGTYADTNKMYVEKMEIVPSANNPYQDAIKINQIGYLPEQQKIGIVSYEKGSSTIVPTKFTIIGIAKDSVVYSGSLIRQTVTDEANWGQDGDEVYHANFTTFKTPGQYRMVVDELNQVSQPFEISDTAYNQVFRDALRFFYYSRSGEAIQEPFAEKHVRPSLYESGVAATYDYKPGTRDVKGGWFDAGDTHLDAHAPYEAVWWLLETLRQFEDKVQKQSLNIPESDSGANDMYELIKYELMWYEKLWNRDGSTHFFVTQNNRKTPTLSDVTSSSAAVLSALFAKAYPLYKKHPFYAAYADTLLFKSQKSWEWLMNHPKNVSPIEPSTGKVYGYAKDDAHDQAMRAIAAISLFNATGNATYNTWFTSRFKDPLYDYYDNQAWGGIISGLEQSELNLGYMDYIQSPQPTANQTVISKLKAAFITQANWTMQRIGFTAYEIPLAAPNHLFWGSSGLIATHAYIYDQVYQWTKQVKYKNAISNSVDWILGRNPVNSIFVTGYGDTIHGVDIYSFFWDDNFNAPPGYLCGNIMAYDEATIPIIKYPWKRFLNIQSAPTLEPGIYWNSELAWLMGYMAQNAGPKRDCTGAINGLAYLDACQECVGGNTGKTACIPSHAETVSKDDLGLNVYPNPSDGKFIIAGNLKGKWQIYNLMGALLLSGQNETIDLSAYPPGLYLFKMNAKTLKITKK